MPRWPRRPPRSRRFPDAVRFIAVKANLSNNTYSDNVNMFEEDPDLAEQLLDVIREFENPARRPAR